ncbi:MAG: tetratricopeptide repeat protein [Phycisphaerales bacterium]|nr:tetratricopeptide repeat protein [Phycisphaerales bacterium]
MQAHRLVIECGDRIPEGVKVRVRREAGGPGKATDDILIHDPATVRVDAGAGAAEAGGPALPGELHWYLEHYLEHPTDVDEARARRCLKALQGWGERAFKALFDSGTARDFYTRAVEAGLAQLTIVISADDPAVLSWPWEALRDPQAGDLARQARFERRLNQQHDPAALHENLGKQQQVNILLVTARPRGRRDVSYRSVSRPLVELVHSDPEIRARVTVLRPPTFKALQEHLRARPGRYHIVHFDGHGVFTGGTGGAAPQGHLVFEPESGDLYDQKGDLTKDPKVRASALIPAPMLAQAMREHNIPVVVLNACQSGMIANEAGDAFASVAGSLIQAGVRGVVAMAYSLWVSGAKEFLPAFYGTLFDTGSLAEAVRLGRERMAVQPVRTSAKGPAELQDWLVPVLYQQAEVDLEFAEDGRAEDPVRAALDALPEPFKDLDNPHGLIGRDGPILELERALLRPPPGVLMHGLGGVGKTTLARGLARWLVQTDSDLLYADAKDDNGEARRMLKPPIWISFQGVLSAEYVLNEMGRALYGPDFSAVATQVRERQKAQGREMSDREVAAALLINALKQSPRLIVWDNFEVVRGMEGQTGALSETDRNTLREFLKALRTSGSAAKVVITSRGEEEWLGDQSVCFRPRALGGLSGEELWSYTEAVLKDLGLSVDRTDQSLMDLLSEVAGHPLMLRVILPKLAERSPGELLEALRRNLDELDLPQESEEVRKLYATLRLAEQAVPEELRPLLIPLSMHEEWVFGKFLFVIAEEVDKRWTEGQVGRFLDGLVRAGVLHQRGPGLYEQHPALARYLRAAFKTAPDVQATWARAAVKSMAAACAKLVGRPRTEQEWFMAFYERTLSGAVETADSMGRAIEARGLIEGLGSWALNNRRLADAERWFSELARRFEAAGMEENAATSYHQLGLVAFKANRYQDAERLYRRAGEVFERVGSPLNAAVVQHELGNLALSRRDWDAAWAWFEKAATACGQAGSGAGLAAAYHGLGNVLEQQNKYEAAEAMYTKSLAIKKGLGDEQSIGTTYTHLGNTAMARRDFAAAWDWYHKSLEIKERLADFPGQAVVLHNLGRIAQVGMKLDLAENYLRRSVSIKERQGMQREAAITYHQLGTLALQRQDFVVARDWYLKSAEVKRRLGDAHGAAMVQADMGVLELAWDHPIAAGESFRAAIIGLESCKDPAAAANLAELYFKLWGRAPAEDRLVLEAKWSEDGLGEFPREVAMRVVAHASGTAPGSADEATKT